MKAFLNKLVLFILSFIGVTIISIVAINNFVKIKADLKFDPQKTTLILGHSHPQCAFNDSLIDNTKNLSRGAEPYFYTNIKIKEILKHNPQINTIFIGYDNNQINKSINDWIWGKKYLPNIYKTYSPFINYNEFLLLCRNGFSNLLKSTPIAIKNQWSRITKNDYTFNDLGGYWDIKTSKTDSILSSNKKKPILIEKRSILNLEYLDKIVSNCKSENKKIYFIRSPLHKESTIISNEKEFIEIKNNRYPNIEFLDFSKYPSNNSEFVDLEHLNYRGAKKFSLWLNKLLNDQLLTKKNKQQYIDEKIKEISLKIK